MTACVLGRDVGIVTVNRSPLLFFNQPFNQQPAPPCYPSLRPSPITPPLPASPPPPLSLPPPSAASQPAHLGQAVGGVALRRKHRLPDVLGRVLAPAGDAGRGVKVAVRGDDRVAGQPRLQLQRVDVLPPAGWCWRVCWEGRERRGASQMRSSGRQGAGPPRASQPLSPRQPPPPSPAALRPNPEPTRTCVKQRSRRPLSWRRRMKWWVGVGAKLPGKSSRASR